MGVGKNKKKYSEINMTEVLFGDSVTVFDQIEDECCITLFMKSRATQGSCPLCGVVSDQYHSTYHRNLQAAPISRSEKMDLKAFAQVHSVAVPTLKKYLAMSEEEVEQLSERHIQNRNKNTIIGPYLNIIYKMLHDGFKGDFIYSYILHIGYKGKPSTMIDIIKCIALNNFRIHLPMDFPFYKDIPPSVSVIQRSDVLRYITLKDHTAMEDSDTAKYITVIKDAYPVVTQMEEMYQLFHSILMGGKPEKLDGFIDKYKDMEGIAGFIDGLKRDITPVKNAISLPYSSGFVEGNNNKFKLVKRILYGRSGLANLFRKCYAAFSITQTNVSVQSLIPGLNERMKKFTEKIMALTQS